VDFVLSSSERKQAGQGSNQPVEEFSNGYVEIILIHLGLYGGHSWNRFMVLRPKHGSTHVNEPNSTN